MQLNQAITVRIMPATNTQPKKWKAISFAGTLVMPDDTSKPIHPEWDNYIPEKKALVIAQAYCKYNKWPEPVAGGMLKNGDWVFVTSLITT